MRSGNANRCLGVGAIFHSKNLHNDGQRSASSRLLSVKNEKTLAVIMLLHPIPLSIGAKSLIAQIPAAFKFTTMQRNDGRAPDEIRPVNFELNVAPHANGSVLVSMGNTRVICAVTIEETVLRWMKEQAMTGGWVTAEYSMLPYSTQPRKPRNRRRRVCRSAGLGRRSDFCGFATGTNARTRSQRHQRAHWRPTRGLSADYGNAAGESIVATVFSWLAKKKGFGAGGSGG